uniref:palmitoyl-protein hydrolase n=3 Tax=Cacopsylla melanoneura TaxID=428564 RepID=A0A8D9A3U2_9HEMI
MANQLSSIDTDCDSDPGVEQIYSDQKLLEFFGEHLHRNGAVKVVKYVRRKQTGTVIFLHGSGGNGFEMRQYLSLLRDHMDITIGARHIRFLFPSAPVKEYTAIYGQKSRVWHDRQGIHINLPEMKSSINEQAEVLKVFIDNLVKAGTPISSIVIGGFSMGGGMALHMAYRYFPQMAGCFALSSFLHNDSMVYEDLAKAQHTSLPPLIAFHGDKDYTVPIDWGQQMYNRLISLGVKGEFHTVKNETHNLAHDEVDRGSIKCCLDLK